MNVNVSMGIVQLMSTSTNVSVNLALRVSNVIQVRIHAFLIKHLIYLIQSIKWVNFLFSGKVFISDTITLWKKTYLSMNKTVMMSKYIIRSK